MRTFSFLRSVVLAIYVAFETARSPRKYREMKAAVDSGDHGARRSLYVEILRFEWIWCRAGIRCRGLLARRLPA
jgi:hypothetical protein